MSRIGSQRWRTAGGPIGAALVALCVALPGQRFDARPYWEREYGHVALQQAALDASTDQLALIISSHPDDRHVMPAAYLRFGRGWRVAILLFTRGEGGQNSKGPEIGDALGWRRTLESEASAALVDADVYYLNRQDAGFCRSAAEALELWGRDDTIDALARVIRRVRPDVVLTTHYPEENHGHDLGLLEVLPEALARAADPTFEGLPPIAVTKAFRGPAQAEEDRVRDALPMDETNRARGDSYRRIAYAALKKHESQEPIRPMEELFAAQVPLFPLRDTAPDDVSAWLLTAGLPSLFSGLDGDPEAQTLKRELDELVARIGSPASLVQQSVDLIGRLRRLDIAPGLDAEVRLQRRLDALARVILHGSGFRVTAELPDGVEAVAGEIFPLRIRVQNDAAPVFESLKITATAGGDLALAPGGASNARLLSAPDGRGEIALDLESGRSSLVQARYRAPGAAADQRAWLRALFGGVTFAPPIGLQCQVRVRTAGGAPLDLPCAVIVPSGIRAPVELEVTPTALMLSQQARAETLTVYVTRHTGAPVQGNLEVLAPPGFVVEGSPAAVKMTAARYQDFQFRLRAPASLRPGVYNLHVRLAGLRAVVPVHKVDVEVSPDLKVGLIRGVDDTAEAVLGAFVGDNLEILDEDKLARRRFEDFDTVVVDIRALRERPDSFGWRAARAAFPRLLSFVRSGGRLVVLYHKDTEFNVESSGFVGSPYPLVIGRGRVTREDAPVQILLPQHPLLHRPNRIQPDDWDGWVQERGLYFPATHGDEFEELLAIADPGHPVSRGALLFARHGKGEYVYCALALYRQLDSLHPGACRIFANLISR